MDTVFYLETGSLDPGYNLAFEEYVLAHRTQGTYLILWQNKNSVIIGRNQNAEAEINRAFVDAHGIKVVRRNTGGGAVYHDLGNLNYSFITDADEPEKRSSAQFTAPVVQALCDLGLSAETSGRNDILVDGRKVSGTAQQLLKGRLLHHGTLLFDSDAAMIAGALNPDPTKFQSKGIQSVRSRVGNIRSALAEDMDIPSFWQYLKKALVKNGITPTSLSAHELLQIQKLKEEKYDTWQWNFGKSPKYQLCCKNRWPAGLLEVHLTVSEGKIAQLAIMGDFLATMDVAPLQEALIQCPYREDAISEVLDRFNLLEHLGGITGEEFLQTVLNKTKETS